MGDPMALSNCEHCGSIEGGFREPDEAELLVMQKTIDPMIDGTELEDLICEQCGEAGGYRGIPEHDDFDMER
jgi:hypothetical protein